MSQRTLQPVMGIIFCLLFSSIQIDYAV